MEKDKQWFVVVEVSSQIQAEAIAMTLMRDYRRQLADVTVTSLGPGEASGGLAVHIIGRPCDRPCDSEGEGE